MSKSISTASEVEIRNAIGFLSATKDSFSTIDIIRQILGSYQSDTDTPAGSSPNALFGKKLSKNAASYRILRLSRKSGQDDSGNRTTTVIWRPV